MASAKDRKIKNILINPAYQLKYVMWISGTGLTLIVANVIVFYHYIKENYAILVDLSPMDDAAKGQLYKELNEIIVKLGLFGFLFVIATAIVGIKMSHRTAGPLFQFKRVFGDIKGGKTEARIRLRPGDDFKDVADAFNNMMDAVTAKK